MFVIQALTYCLAMDNRRNYYRILEVQPDAPFEVIRHNYKILMKKLRMHPDLGGNQQDAVLINLAYETLSNPKKRAVYDQKLLQEKDIVQLSQGHLKRNNLFPRRKKISPKSLTGRNRRNYYRLLNVQPDAHGAVIRARYSYLIKKGQLPSELLYEAYVILNNVQKRLEYDRLLRKYGHSKAIQKIKTDSEKIKHNEKEVFVPIDHEILLTDKGIGINKEWDDCRGSNRKEKDEYFEPSMSKYCYSGNVIEAYKQCSGYNLFCPEFSSPLSDFQEDLFNRSGRVLTRIKKTGPIFFYIHRDGPRLHGYIFDISPLGLRFMTRYELDIGQNIKIYGENFESVAKVIHNRIENDQVLSIGVQFEKVAFYSAKSNFLQQNV